MYESSMAAAADHLIPDFESLKCERRIGLETLVVHALNQWVLYVEKLFLCISLRANTSPGDYGCKVKT